MNDNIENKMQKLERYASEMDGLSFQAEHIRFLDDDATLFSALNIEERNSYMLFLKIQGRYILCCEEASKRPYLKKELLSEDREYLDALRKQPYSEALETEINEFVFKLAKEKRYHIIEN